MFVASPIRIPAFLQLALTLATANPVLTPGVWTDITPPGIVKGAPETCLGQGVAIDPKNPSTIYWGTTPYTASAGGLFKSIDAGSTWRRIGKVAPLWQGAGDMIDMPLHVRINPDNPLHLYVGDGVRGTTQGFFVSTDGGENFVRPKRMKAILDSAGVPNQDIYDVAVDPTDFNHVLISYHYWWGDQGSKWGMNAGFLESKDGGESWKIHAPVDGWGTGHSIKFLFHPGKNIGNANTWLLGTQGDGYWRTTDAGGEWTRVSTTNIAHGGSTAYYAKTGLLYVSGERTLRSADNGATWTTAWSGSSWCVFGDGNLLYSGRPFGGDQPFQVSLESDGLTWSNLNDQKFSDGPYEMVFDAVNGILYTSSWSDGLWAMKVPAGNSVRLPTRPAGEARSVELFRLDGRFLGRLAAGSPVSGTPSRMSPHRTEGGR